MAYMSEQKAKKIIDACLDEMYKASDPPISWKECEEKYEGVSEWFLKHEIGEEKYEKIRRKYRKKLSTMYKNTLDWSLLNYAPKFKGCEKVGKSKSMV